MEPTKVDSFCPYFPPDAELPRRRYGIRLLNEYGHQRPAASSRLFLRSDYKKKAMDESVFNLPPIKPYKRRLGHSYGFSDQYGAFQVAAKHCNVRNACPFPGIWQHGCFGPWDQISPGSILYHSPALKDIHVYVARNDEKDYLLSCGLTKVAAIGLPFVYLPTVETERRKNSLLVVPTHSVAGIPLFKDRAQCNQYVDSIVKMRNEFAEIVVCLHYGDIVNKYWVDEFQEAGISYVLGAVPHDENSLLRTKKMFHMFEYVTTNGWGSHVAYALTCGAKVSISGPSMKIDPLVASKDLGAGGLENFNSRFAEKRRRMRASYLSDLYREPLDGIINVKMGAHLIGLENKLSGPQLMKAFGWHKVGFMRQIGIRLSRKSADLRIYTPQLLKRVRKKFARFAAR